MKRIWMFTFVVIFCLLENVKVYAGEAASMENFQDIVDTTDHIYTFAEMECDLAELVAKYPDFITCSVIGKSLDSRNIWQIVIGNPQAPKAIHIQAGIHGREWMNCWMLMKQVEEILKNRDTPLVSGVSYGTILEQCAVYIMPMVNPDGVTISQVGIEGIVNEGLRYNLYQMKGAPTPSKWKANAAGVDLNRNFSVGWGKKVNVNAPCSEFYNGVAPFTEPETLAVVNSFATRKFDIAITYHSMEGALYFDIGQQGELRNKNFELAILVNQITGYQYEEYSDVHGLDYNWIIFDQNTPTVLIETGTVPCPLPYSQWDCIWNRNKDLIMLLALNYAYK